MRPTDDEHVKALVKQMNKEKNSDYTIMLLHLSGVNKSKFNESAISDFTYETLGGNHTRLAYQQVHGADSDIEVQAKIYCGLTYIEALRLGVSHNEIHELAKKDSFMDCAIRCRNLLYKTACLDPESDPVLDDKECENWKNNVCRVHNFATVSILYKQIKNVSIIYIQIKN